MSRQSLSRAGFREITVLLSALCLPTAIAGAQTASPLAKGARVRVVTLGTDGRPARRITGDLVQLQGDTLIIADGDHAFPVVLDGERRLEVRTGSRGNGKEGAALGALVGGLTGAVIGAATWEPCTETGWFACFLHPSQDVQAGAGALLGVAGGAVIGLLVGAANRTETWAPRQTAGVRVAVSTRAVGVELAF